MKTREERRVIAEIKKLGCKWKITHKSSFDGRKQTVALVKMGNDYYQGYAQCGEHDNFDKKIGRAISLGRAFKNLIEGRIISKDSIAREFLFVEDRGDNIIDAEQKERLRKDKENTTNLE